MSTKKKMNSTVKSSGTTPVSRRAFLGYLGAVAFSAPFVHIPGKARASERLVVVNYGGPLADAKRKVYYEPFTKETGIPITQLDGPDFAKVRAQVQAKDVEWDVVDLIDTVLPLGDKLGLFERIDESIVNREGVIPHARREYAIGNYVYAGGIAYATEKRKNAPKAHPENWKDFFNIDAFPGRRGLRKRVQENLELALMGDGVPASKVYPCDVERAFKALDRIKPHINQWIGAQAQTIALIQQNECDFNYAYSNQVLVAQQSQIPVGYSRKQNLLGIGFSTVLKGTRNKDAAMRLCAFIMRKDRQIALANLTGMSPVYPGTEDKIDKSVRDWLPDITNKENLFNDPNWWSDQVEKLTLRFQEWMAAK